MEPKIDRFQQTFLRESLDESIGIDNPVRVYDFILSQHDWGEWENEYAGGGRPSYPPDAMSKLLVYGYSRGIRSSRQLEYACRNNRDFIWLTSGLTPDHDTIADFRRRHIRRFKSIFRTTVAACVEAGLVDMKHVAVDGTRVEANNSRRKTGTASGLKLLLKAIDDRIEKILGEADAEDRREDDLYGKGVSPNDLPKELKDLTKRKEILEKALRKARAKTEGAKKMKGKRRDDAEKKRVPYTDPDADVMKGKQGGFGPNFTPWIAGDSKHGIILGEGVTNDQSDAPHFRGAIEEAEDTTGLEVKQALADGNYPTTENLEYCEEKGIDPCMAPLKTSLERGKEEDEEKEGKLPWPDDVPESAVHADGRVVDGRSIARSKNGMFDKSAFVYDAWNDRYICPLGHPLMRVGIRDRRVMYQCSKCKGCPFVKMCTSSKSVRRAVGREPNAEIHERHARRMLDYEKLEDYKLRRQTVEPVFGTIKGPQGLRKFLLRNLDYVRGEWSIASAAFNIKRFANIMAAD